MSITITNPCTKKANVDKKYKNWTKGIGITAIISGGWSGVKGIKLKIELLYCDLTGKGSGRLVIISEHI